MTRIADKNSAYPGGSPDYGVTGKDLQEIHRRRVEAAKLQKECAQKRAEQVSRIIDEIQKQPK